MMRRSVSAVLLRAERPLRSGVSQGLAGSLLRGLPHNPTGAVLANAAPSRAYGGQLYTPGGAGVGGDVDEASAEAAREAVGLGQRTHNANTNATSNSNGHRRHHSDLSGMPPDAATLHSHHTEFAHRRFAYPAHQTLMAEVEELGSPPGPEGLNSRRQEPRDQLDKEAAEFAEANAAVAATLDAGEGAPDDVAHIEWYQYTPPQGPAGVVALAQHRAVQAEQPAWDPADERPESRDAQYHRLVQAAAALVQQQQASMRQALAEAEQARDSEASPTGPGAAAALADVDAEDAEEEEPPAVRESQQFPHPRTIDNREVWFTRSAAPDTTVDEAEAQRILQEIRQDALYPGEAAEAAAALRIPLPEAHAYQDAQQKLAAETQARAATAAASGPLYRVLSAISNFGRRGVHTTGIFASAAAAGPGGPTPPLAYYSNPAERPPGSPAHPPKPPAIAHFEKVAAEREAKLDEIARDAAAAFNRDNGSASASGGGNGGEELYGQPAGTTTRALHHHKHQMGDKDKDPDVPPSSDAEIDMLPPGQRRSEETWAPTGQAVTSGGGSRSGSGSGSGGGKLNRNGTTAGAGLSYGHAPGQQGPGATASGSATARYWYGGVPPAPNPSERQRPDGEE